MKHTIIAVGLIALISGCSTPSIEQTSQSAESQTLEKFYTSESISDALIIAIENLRKENFVFKDYCLLQTSFGASTDYFEEEDHYIFSWKTQRNDIKPAHVHVLVNMDGEVKIVKE